LEPIPTANADHVPMGLPAQLLHERVVLVVDDEDLVRHMTARTLTGGGLRVLEARDGEEAVSLLETLGSNAVGLVVSDIRMPRMDGLQLAGTVAQRWPEVPILLMSGQGGPPTGYAGPYFAKPFKPETLLAAVTALVGCAF
jgi:CheY-like chemotaxis protein